MTVTVIHLRNGEHPTPMAEDISEVLAHPENLSPGEVVPFMVRVYRDWGLFGDHSRDAFVQEYWRKHLEHANLGSWVLSACLGIFWLDTDANVRVNFRLHYALLTSEWAGFVSSVLPPVELRIRGVDYAGSGSYRLAPEFRVVAVERSYRGYRTMRLS